MRSNLMDIGKYCDCLRLNLQAAQLLVRCRWIGSRQVKASYDRIAPHYDANWLCRLRSVTDRLLTRLPEVPAGKILDLGCGTGYTTGALAARYPNAEIIAQDISDGMLAVARKNYAAKNVAFADGDMRGFLKNTPPASVQMIVSAWAIGYANPPAVLREARRVLCPGGVFAFVVNLRDSLYPLYIAFRRTMQHFPNELQALAFPRFPKSWQHLSRQAAACGLTALWHDEGYQPIAMAHEAGLPWLLRTGVLAGFDNMLPLQDKPHVADYFERCLREQAQPLRHHYIMGILQRS